MNKEEFLEALQNEILEYNKVIATEKGDWIVKGFIDIYKKIYTITIDTKVVSKVIEILLIPQFEKFAQKYNLNLILPPQQNFYPDLSFVCKETGNKFAVDIKSTFKDSQDKIKSMTLGAFTGYFRNRESNKNTTFPYQDYQSHLVLGVIYTQVSRSSNEKEVYSLEEIDKIESVIKDFQFFVQPKYKIASASPGSGNTKNIGAINKLEKLIKGEGVFSELGEEVYDDYWTFYLTNDMAKALEIKRPYINLKTYLEYKSKGIDILKAHKDEILELNEEEIEEDLENGEE
ncbi:type II restriction endonuclease [uncultured Chryseobacterium sp.]|uniref:type II restriction endonuclease n=1 Tax=uncultured Chryseobacterium sp. TaxID=259322 RepID=UPI0025FE5158|nr:type II restriction endonuclease [uncultured Chryseobacterium sp.]